MPHLLSGQHLEVTALHVVEDRGHGPRDADAQEDVDGVRARDVADRGVSVRVLLGRHFGGEGICGGRGRRSKVARVVYKRRGGWVMGWMMERTQEDGGSKNG